MLATLLTSLALGASVARASHEIIVRPGSSVATPAAALALARPGDTITVTRGTYRLNALQVQVPRVLLRGEGWPVFDGGGSDEILVLAADSITVEGIRFLGAGVSMTRDQAAIRVLAIQGCNIVNDRIEGSFFGVYLQRAHGCRVAGNVIRGSGADEVVNGNGIHLWNATDAAIDSNVISGHRDGIYLEFSHRVVATGNESRGNRRYGLHFMFSDGCRYEGNRFVGNGAGEAVMYSRAVTLRDNLFAQAHGASAYGLLLKEIRDSHIQGNRFVDNSVALYTEGASRNEITGNDFRANGWGIRLLASSEENYFALNRFSGNSFDVTTNGQSNDNRFVGNWWDRYDGYDLDHDGVGDVPFRPVRRFALLVEQHEPAVLLMRSPFAALLDLAESVLPVLTPGSLEDAHPQMSRQHR